MASTNNCLNNTSTTSVANSGQLFVLINNDNTGASGAQLQLTVAGSVTTGDPQTTYVVTGATTWSTGIDNSASDAFVIANSAALGTTNYQSIATTGVVSWPSQPAFLAYLGTDATNATGNGTVFQLGSGTALTEVFDRAGNFNTNGTFTAPATGQVYLAGNVELSATTINTGIEIRIVTSNRTYSNRFNRAAAATSIGISLTTLADMDSADTATLSVIGYGEGADTETVTGVSGNLINYFCGYLMG
jgi:hypothetical protein